MAKRTFESFMVEVAHYVSELTGGEITDVDDLPDFAYADAYEDDLHPKTTARRALKAAME